MNGRGSNFFNVLQNDQRLANRVAVVDEHRDLLVDGDNLKQELTLVLKVFLHVLLFYPLFIIKGNEDPQAKHVVPSVENLERQCGHGELQHCTSN
ncbi:hypothetical protein GOP47_0024966 [Adiantum capillus-veneris]|uniref:Uncharacterized protein n=1 Tax=Adiantum capillus-veneris TaxID=13818 RepID=A0A9D4U2S7_ADICA|nr:hypothetical protein GOP47_0024966 [Adiantum capillus-veneris]